MPAKTPSDGDWFLQYSFKVQNGDLVNVRGNSEEQFAMALALMEKSLVKIQEIGGMLSPRATPSTAMRTNAPAAMSTAAPAPVPEPTNGNAMADAMAVGDAFVKTINVDKVYAKKDTGRKNARGAVFSPGTIQGTDGGKYDTFDEGLLDLATEALRTGQRANVMYKYNETYKRNTIVEKGFSLYGVVTGEGSASGAQY